MEGAGRATRPPRTSIAAGDNARPPLQTVRRDQGRGPVHHSHHSGKTPGDGRQLVCGGRPTTRQGVTPPLRMPPRGAYRLPDACGSPDGVHYPPRLFRGRGDNVPRRGVRGRRPAPANRAPGSGVRGRGQGSGAGASPPQRPAYSRHSRFTPIEPVPQPNRKAFFSLKPVYFPRKAQTPVTPAHFSGQRG